MIEIRDTFILRGPNIWAPSAAIRLLVDSGGTTSQVPGLVERLVELFASIADAQANDHSMQSLTERLRACTSVSELLLDLALELQRLAGASVRYSRVWPTPESNLVNLVYGYDQAEAGVAAGQFAVRLLNQVLYDAEPDLDAREGFELQVIRPAERLSFGPSTRTIVEAAKQRGIPVLRLDPDRSLVQLGHGRFQKRIWTTLTSETSDLGAKLATDKQLTSRLLRDVGIPAPEGIAVRTAEEAVRKAESIGYPVVLKPLDGNHGRGVFTNLRDEEAVRSAFLVAVAESRSRDVLVESHVMGRDFRVVVVDNVVVAVAERVPAHVVGDGEQTVSGLIDRTNADPRRGIGHEKILTRIVVDQATRDLLSDQGIMLESVPEAGQVVWLKQTANMSTGGTAIDRTDDIHPDNALAASDAARAIGLDVAGIDFVTPDIGRSYQEVGGGIVEVNAGPGFRMHTHPTEGTPRPVGKAVIDMLFPTGAPSRVPIVAVTGTNGKTTTTRMIAHIMRTAGRTVGLTTTDGIEIDGRLVASGDMAGPASAQLVLRHPRVDFAVLETARGGILRTGLGFDRCDVAVVTNVASDHLGLKGIDTLDDLARVKAVLPTAVFRDGAAVLNADNRWTVEMAAGCRGETIYFSLDEDSPVVRDHLRDHGRAVVLAAVGGDEVLTLIDRFGKTSVMPARDIPATAGGRIRVNIANAMAAVAAAVAQNVPMETIRAALANFGNGFDQTPGRFNLLMVEGREVIVDYGHNVEALRSVGEFVQRSNAPASIGVITSPGDRRDVDISEFGALAAQIFDHLIIRDGSTLRDRPPGQVVDLLRRAAIGAGMPADRITVIEGDLAAAHAAIDMASPGDLVHVMTERIALTWDSLTERAQRAHSPKTNGIAPVQESVLAKA